jgi:hypothetical protein
LLGEGNIITKTPSFGLNDALMILMATIA